MSSFDSNRSEITQTTDGNSEVDSVESRLIETNNAELIALNRELKSKVEELTRSNNDLRELMVATDIATIFLSPELKIKSFTPPAANLLRLNPTDSEQPLADLCGCFRDHNLVEDAQQVLASLQTIERELRNVDGRWFLVRVRPYRTTGNKIVGVVLTFIEITRSRDNEDVREQRQNLKAALSLANVGVWRFDPVNNLMKLDEVARQLFGFREAEEISVSDLMEVVYPEDREKVAELLQKARSEGSSLEIEHRIVRAEDNQVRWIYSKGGLTSEPSPTHNQIVGASFDITERKSSEVERNLLLHEIRGEHAQQTEILESIGDIFYALDDNFNFTYVNYKAEEAWGRKRQELIGKNYWAEFPSAVGSLCYEMHLQALASGQPVHYENLSPLINRLVDVSIYPKTGGGLLVYLHDINERKKTEERLRIAIEAAGLGTWDWNLLTDEIQWNEQHYMLFGLPPSNAPMHPIDFFNYVHPDDKEQVSQRLNRAIDERTIFEAEFRAILLDGTIRWMSGYGRVVEEVDGRPVRMCGVMFDSTQRKLVVEKLRDSEERFRTIVNQATASVTEVDLENRFTFVNQTFCQTIGYTESELLGMGWEDVTHPEDLPRCVEIFEKAIASGESVFNEKRVICKDGTHKWVNESISCVRGEKQEAKSAVAVLIDVTEGKRAEDALRKSEEQYRAIIDQASVGILQCDLEGRVQVVNDQLGIMLGYTTEEMLQTRVQDMTYEEDVPFAMDKFVEMVTLGTPIEIEKRCVRRDGSKLSVSASVSPIRNEQGAPQGASVIIVDITKRQEAEEKLRAAHNELEQRVRDRTQELAEALEHVQNEIEQRKKAEAGRDQLLRQVVYAQEEERRRLSRELHDNMGQHLTAILLAVQALELQNQGAENDKQPAILGNLARLRGMVDELLGVSHRLAWEIRPAVLDNIGLKAALEQYVINWSQKSAIEADFMSRLPNDQTALPADAETALFRVAQEALTNVQRHSGASQVSVVLEQNDDSVALIVEDDGRGFDIENNDYSTRLGMMGMQERLELVGGTLTLESSEDTGLTVYARVSLNKRTDS